MLKNTLACLLLFLLFMFLPTIIIKAEDKSIVRSLGRQCMTTPSQNTNFRVPVDSSKTYISTEYEDYHSGIDFASNTVEENPSIHAAETGVVEYAADSGYDFSEDGIWYSGYGNMVVINHLNGLYSLYGHLDKIGVKTGQLLEKGKVIGKMGATGYSTGTHLHFEICTFSCKSNLAYKHNPHNFMDISKILVRLE